MLELRDSFAMLEPIYSRIKKILLLHDLGTIPNKTKCLETDTFLRCEKQLALYLEWHAISVIGRLNKVEYQMGMGLLPHIV